MRKIQYRLKEYGETARGKPPRKMTDDDDDEHDPAAAPVEKH